MSTGLRAEIADALERDASMEQILGILRKYRDLGVSAGESVKVVEAMRADVGERAEDRLLEILDVVSGFCRPESRVWSETTQSRSPASIVVLKDKAEDFRRIVLDLGFEHTESVVSGEPGILRFTFELTHEESLRLLDKVPREFYAHRAYLR